MRGENMGRPMLDITGRRFFRLVAIERDDSKSDGHHIFWRCKCDCGNEIVVRKDSLLSGHAKSCGCYLDKKRHDGQNKTHGMKHTRIYNVWQSMKDRCFNPNATKYNYYGGRGISVCEEWRNKENGFLNFYNWSMTNGYAKDLTIDRINVNGNYEPSNCRWATIAEQNNNKRTNIKASVFGKEMTVREISDKYGLSTQVVRRRIKSGITDEKKLLYKGNLRELK